MNDEVRRADETEGGYVGWTIVAEGEDGSLLLQSKTGARRRIWPPHKADDDEPVTEETTMPEHPKETPIPDIRAEAEQCLQRQREARTPWFVHDCGVRDCWCRVVTIDPDPESRDMEKCVVASGALHANDAETLVAVMNSPLPILALELCDRVERAEAEVERLRKQINARK